MASFYKDFQKQWTNCGVPNALICLIFSSSWPVGVWFEVVNKTKTFGTPLRMAEPCISFRACCKDLSRFNRSPACSCKLPIICFSESKDWLLSCGILYWAESPPMMTPNREKYRNRDKIKEIKSFNEPNAEAALDDPSKRNVMSAKASRRSSTNCAEMEKRLSKCYGFLWTFLQTRIKSVSEILQ